MDFGRTNSGLRQKLLRSLLFASACLLLGAAAALAWLRWESAQPLEAHWRARHGELVETGHDIEARPNGLQVENIRVRSDSGLVASFQVLRRGAISRRMPVLVILGGQETGGEAVHLFEEAGPRAVVAIDYPYDGSRDFKGVVGFVRNLPAMRQACRDTPAAVGLTLDWLVSQDWVDPDRIVLAGVSFGVPFAAAAAAGDSRVGGLILAHGAADNQAWAVATAERHLPAFVAGPVGTFVNWLGYGPAYDTASYVRRVAPRPILVVGAREDERTPAGQTEILFDAASPNRLLRWTDGRHVQVSRRDVVEQLMDILQREMPFLTGGGDPD
ncbi:MAG: prolyl oligopeptidase family serine peptidase [Gammaproteobacteria bacterium]|nr:prolyl oligopeptidase family serine peptidase [Gammaproteobacteria bacterium]MDH4254883.1 prolyl oligopeptidase family serine peptidase [Gammaproteobacteria bacterium]MDH5310606.1 prolyl oligopeptidase family serine peptidase [Gammaproteobacteria bacterium]